MNAFFFIWHKNHKKLFSQDLRVDTKIPGTFVEILYYSLISQWNSSDKNVGAVEREFSKPRIPRFWVEILEI